MPSLRHPAILVLAATLGAHAACSSGGTTSTSGTLGMGTGGDTATAPAGLSCSETVNGITQCEVFPAGVTTCPGGAQVTSCPTANLLGVCKLENGGLVHFYSAPGFTAATAQSGCTSEGGTWTPA